MSQGEIKVHEGMVIPEQRSPARCDICGADDTHVARFEVKSEIRAYCRQSDVCEECLMSAGVALRRAKHPELGNEAVRMDLRRTLRPEAGKGDS